MNMKSNRKLKALLLVGVIVCLGACGGGSSSSGVSSLYVGTYAGVETTTFYDWDHFANGYQVTEPSGFVVSSDGKFLTSSITGCERGGIQDNTISMSGNTASSDFSGTCETSSGKCVIQFSDLYVFSTQGVTRTTEFSFSCESDAFWGTLQGVYQKVSG
jgi:hypothetical protein